MKNNTIIYYLFIIKIEMEYSAQIYTNTNLNLEKEVLDIIKAGQDYNYSPTSLTVSESNDILNNYFINKAIFIDKKEFHESCKITIFIDNYGNIYEFLFRFGSNKYWASELHINNLKYKIKLPEISIDTIKLITGINSNNFKNIIRGIVKINELINKQDNIYNLIILEIDKLKEEKEQLKEENEQLENKILNKKNIDNNFICSITLEVMKDPVICSDGHTYERSAIEKWLSTNSCSPMTRQIITNKSLIPNIALRNIIQEYEKNHKMCL